MAWVSVYQQLRDHNKTRDLFRQLDIKRSEAVGTLVLLWTWAIDNCDKDGRLLSCIVDDIAEAAYWKGDPKVLYDALVQTGWIDERDGEMYLHDWYEYNKPFYDYIEKKEKDKLRKRAGKSTGNTAGNSAENPPETPQENPLDKPLEFHDSHSPTHSPIEGEIKSSTTRARTREGDIPSYTREEMEAAAKEGLVGEYAKFFNDQNGAREIIEGLLSEFRFGLVYDCVREVGARASPQRPQVPSAYIREMCRNRG